ncbi:hypothetical protein BGX28_005424 [Mortierella sp. GBA30]|nr:hypothetical protein BGX28_005424 [Mortierella sp. GBA30]
MVHQQHSASLHTILETLLLTPTLRHNVAITSAAEGVYRIVNVKSGGWMKSFYAVRGPGIVLSKVVINQRSSSIYEHWNIVRTKGERNIITNAGTGYSLFAYGDNVYTSPAGKQTWYFEPAGEDTFHIKVPNEDSLVAALPDGSVVLETADGSDAQKFYFEHIVTDDDYNFYTQ